jgi:hypothetical protein
MQCLDCYDYFIMRMIFLLEHSMIVIGDGRPPRDRSPCWYDTTCTVAREPFLTISLTSSDYRNTHLRTDD